MKGATVSSKRLWGLDEEQLKGTGLKEVDVAKVVRIQGRSPKDLQSKPGPGYPPGVASDTHEGFGQHLLRHADVDGRDFARP